MHESTKTLSRWPDEVKSLIAGDIIDIGCGDSPISDSAVRFDVGDGDANHILRYVHSKFDFVFSSHCLEHMYNPMESLSEWWELVRPGGCMAFIVPDEDLYEQGVFPSVRNLDHKHTFTISKQTSWSPVSINVLDLVKSLHNSTIIHLILQDYMYDRSLIKWASNSSPDQTLNDQTMAQIECILKKDN